MPTGARDRTAASSAAAPAVARRASRYSRRYILAASSQRADHAATPNSSKSRLNRSHRASSMPRRPLHDVGMKRLQQRGMRTLELVERSGAKTVVRLLQPAQRRAGAGAMIEKRIVEIKKDLHAH